MEIAHGALGVPVVRAASLPDAYFAWGLLDVRHRAFQMDVLRRRAAGTLAEVFGPAAVEGDRAQRVLGIARTADAIVARLPADQRELLGAYAAGVNRAARRRRPASLAHALLRTRLQPWTPRDSALALLVLYQGLALDIAGRRTERLVRRCLEEDLATFLLTKDEGAAAGGEPLLAPRALDALLSAGGAASALHTGGAVAGSNCWTVPGSRTASGAPLLACDLHLPVTVPNVWRRIELEVDGLRVSAIAMPGVPIAVAGANGRLAWGVTNLPGDTLDLVSASDVGGPRSQRCDRIAVRGAPDVIVEVTETAEGPILAEPVAGESVVARWAGSWPSATDFGLGQLAFARTVAEGARIATRAGGMPLNVHLADRDGATARTVAGKVPRRTRGELRRDDFLRPDEIPVVPAGELEALVSANDRDTPVPGWNHPPGWRARRIRELLAQRNDWDERSQWILQRDVRAVWLDDFRELALRVLPAGHEPWRRAISEWDGHLRPEATGVPMVSRFRTDLSGRILDRVLAPCARADPRFLYAWRVTDPVILALLDTGDERLLTGLPGATLDERAGALLISSAERLAAEHGLPAERVAWRHVAGGRRARSPFEGSALRRLYPSLRLPAHGAQDCVCAMDDQSGPTQQLVVSPGREHDALFGMVGGQSESPLSRHRADHHRRWLRGAPAPLRARVKP